MLVHEFMEHFVEQSEAVEDALMAASEEINSVSLPHDIGPLRVSYEEISNIIAAACGYAFGDADGMTDEQRRDDAVILEGLDELTKEIFLRQFADTMEEAMASFHADLLAVLRLHPLLMAHIHPIISHLKVRTTTGLSRQKKYERLIDLAETAERSIESAEVESPDYVFRILGEIADFGDCLMLPTDNGTGICPTAVNDNKALN